MRVVQRTADIMRELGTDNPERLRAAGVIDLPTIQKYLNFHYSVSVDLFGQEVSTNAANYFTAGLKGRYQESRLPGKSSFDRGIVAGVYGAGWAHCGGTIAGLEARLMSGCGMIISRIASGGWIVGTGFW